MKSGFDTVECACDQCKAMCAHSVCLPTPEGARALILAGYGHRLSIYKFSPFDDSFSFVAPATVGHEGKILPRTNAGQCTFFKEGKCELHDKNLKPFEGRIARHDRPWKEIRFEAMQSWKGKAFESVRATLLRVTSKT